MVEEKWVSLSVERVREVIMGVKQQKWGGGGGWASKVSPPPIDLGGGGC